MTKATSSCISANGRFGIIWITKERFEVSAGVAGYLMAVVKEEAGELALL